MMTCFASTLRLRWFDGDHAIQMRRARISMALALACAVAVIAGTSGCHRDPPRPNLVLITLDTTRADHLGCYGYTGGTSPNLDRFAAGALLYEHAYSTSSWTLPSHASLMTGLLPMQHGAQSLAGGPDLGLGYGVRALDERFETLAERLAAAGYRTGAVIGGPALRRALGMAQGFETYSDDLSGPGQKFYGRRAEDVADDAIATAERFGDEPYFLFVNFFDPHAPYHPPPPFDRDLPKKDAAAADRAQAVRKLVESIAEHVEARPVAELDPDIGAWLSRELAGYDAEIRYMDHHLGRLLDVLAAGERGARTMIVITGDHGESFGEHYYVSHGANLYEDNVHVPLLVHRPGQATADRDARPLSNVFVHRWLLEAAGIAPAEAAGVDALAYVPSSIVLQVQRSDANVRLFGSVLDRDLAAVLKPPYKLIRSSSGRAELYDLAADPGELHDLSERMPARAGELARALADVEAKHPPLYEARGGAALDDDTVDALKALGYLE